MMPRLPGPFVPALNQRFKSSCDYRVPASGRFARGTVLGGDHLGVLAHSTDFSHSFYREMVLMTSLHSNRPFLSNTLMEHHRPFCSVDGLWLPRYNPLSHVRHSEENPNSDDVPHGFSARLEARTSRIFRHRQDSQ